METIKTDCIVLGAGVAGLSVARELSKFHEDIFVIEKNSVIAEEVSSRNSEVIHAGIYYKPNSLKHKLLYEGKELLYSYLDKYKIPFKKCGKYIIACSSNEVIKLETLKRNAESCGLEDLYFDTLAFSKQYPFIKAYEAVFSPSTGIFDSHHYITNLMHDFNANGGHVLLRHECRDVTRTAKSIQLTIYDHNRNLYFKVESPIVINCAGLNATYIYNLFHKNPSPLSNRLVKGEYYVYTGEEQLNHLVYPIPERDGLGVHATIDMSGQIKFGPSAYEVDAIDYSIDLSRRTAFIKSIQNYWPSIDSSALHASYSGIRPKLLGSDDFTILRDDINSGVFLSVLGYESPGLSASMGLAEYVKRMLVA